MKLAIIGTGNMGKALLRGFIIGGVLAPKDITVCDVREDAVKAVCDEYGVNGCTKAVEAVKDADYCLLAIKPQHFDDTLTSIVPGLSESCIILSIAAAVKCERIESIIGSDKKYVRIMPNTPAQVGCGVSAVCPVSLDKDQTDFVIKLLSTCGEVVHCDEKTLDAIGCVSGTGPAYVMLFIEAMADAAVSLGIKRDDALKIAAATVMGSGKLVLDTKQHPAVLKDQVCSPSGTTIAGVMALEEYGLRNAVIKSVIAASDKTKQLANGK